MHLVPSDAQGALVYDFAKTGTSVIANNNWWGGSNAQSKVNGDVTITDRCADESSYNQSKLTIDNPQNLYYL